ncbi:MAG TPA: MFS transporter, partial [Micromonosporaceae bacterium]|nr:MFS transporter [Micromonosporaceae bacterium]
LDRKRLMVSLDIANAFLIATVPLAAVLGTITVPHLLLVALFVSSIAVWYDAAAFGALPAIVPRDHLTVATSRIFTLNTLAMIGGPSLAGVAIATVGPSQALALDAVTYLISAVLIGSVRTKLSTPRLEIPGATAPLWRQIGRDARVGMRFIFEHPLVRPATLLGIGISATGGAVLGINVVFAVRGLGLASNDPRIGVLYTGGAIGALLATLALPFLAKRIPAGRVTVIGLAVAVVLLLAYATAPGFAIAVVLLLGFQACYTLVTSNGFTLRQFVTPNELQGRVNTFARMIAMSGQPLGAIFAGLAAEAFDVRTALILMTVPLAICAVLAWLTPLRTSTVRTVGTA